MANETTTKNTLELFADELPDQIDLSVNTTAVGGSTAATLTSASCPASTYSTFTTLSSY
ncbi:thiocillin family RiPP [Oceanobacillus sp. M65]|uniref:thiocillin family RiPP n=1 Tax=Oceanobacillus sp. M65 TaxID=3457435 RepID=UPI000D127012